LLGHSFSADLLTCLHWESESL